MEKAKQFLKDWGWVIGLGALGVVLLIVTAGKYSAPLKSAAGRLEEIKADRKASKKLVEEGREAALKAVDAEYDATIQKMDGYDAIKLETLKTNPRERARFLARVAAKRRVG